MVYERRSRPERSLHSAVNNEAVAMKLNPYTVCWVGVHVPRALIRDWRPRSVFGPVPEILGALDLACSMIDSDRVGIEIPVNMLRLS